jgi:tRNA U34 5-carboxymethylaminomethyl modifying GTPase MnmE/TrmE
MSERIEWRLREQDINTLMSALIQYQAHISARIDSPEYYDDEQAAKLQFEFGQCNGLFFELTELSDRFKRSDI